MADNAVVTPPKDETPPAPPKEDQGRLEHVLKDMHRYKEEAKAAKAEAEALRQAKLKEQNDWKTLYESEQAKRQEAEQKTERLQGSFLSHQKNAAVKDAAVAAGLRKEALADLSLLPMDDVQVEGTTTGRINILGADLFVEKLKASRPHWFGGEKPNVNTGTPGVGTGGKGTIGVKDLQTAEKAARKSGDYAAYSALLKQYQAQKK